MTMSTKSPPLHQLGRNGPMVPALGLGLMGMSHGTYGTIPSDDERFALLDRAVELGETFWDTSDLYGDNEALLGKWFRRTGKRDHIFLATKFGYVSVGKSLQVKSSYSYCKQACEESLRVLGIDSIDLYYMHNANPETPIEETMRAMAELKAEGKIKHIGLSTVCSSTIRRAVKVAPVAAMQVEYSVFATDIEGPAGTDLLATCRELGVALVIACPLGRGMITSSFVTGDNTASDGNDRRTTTMPRFMGANRDHNAELVRQFKVFADEKGCTVPQLALAWLLKQGDDIFPIPGTRRIKYLEENWAALAIHLSDEEEASIRAFQRTTEAAGRLVPQAYESYLYRDTKEDVESK